MAATTMGMQFSIRFFAFLLALAFAVPAGACTLANWSETVGTQLSAGSPTDNHRRYSGECALKVLLSNSPSYLVDTNPEQESSYFARFYVFTGDLKLARDGFVDLFAGYAHEANSVPEFKLRLEQQASGPALIASARDRNNFAQTNTVALEPGWHALEVYWQEALGGANGKLLLTVDGIERAALQGLNNAGGNIDAVRLGAVAQSDASGRLDFDAFSSHRATPVGVLLRGDASGDKGLDATDLVVLVRELNAQSSAPGQPDCNGDGEVDNTDLRCVANRVINP